MKTIGLLGGMSWESTLHYYRLINQEVQRRLGGLHSAKVVIYSFDFFEIEALQRDGRWEEAGELLSDGAAALERAGAEVLLICANTMHKVAESVQKGSTVPLLHIADVTGAATRDKGLATVGLLGTRFTMEEKFLRERLHNRFGIEVMVPGSEDRKVVHDIIYRELCRGIIESDSRGRMAAVMDDLISLGAKGIILGCTELPLLVDPETGPVPLLDTTSLHAVAAVDYALGDSSASPPDR